MRRSARLAAQAASERQACEAFDVGAAGADAAGARSKAAPEAAGAKSKAAPDAAGAKSKAALAEAKKDEHQDDLAGTVDQFVNIYIKALRVIADTAWNEDSANQNEICRTKSWKNDSFMLIYQPKRDCMIDVGGFSGAGRVSLIFRPLHKRFSFKRIARLAQDRMDEANNLWLKSAAQHDEEGRAEFLEFGEPWPTVFEEGATFEEAARICSPLTISHDRASLTFEMRGWLEEMSNLEWEPAFLLEPELH